MAQIAPKRGIWHQKSQNIFGVVTPSDPLSRAAPRARRVHDRLQTRDLALGRRQVQSGASLAVGGGEVGARDEVADDGGVAPGGGRMQRGVVKQVVNHQSSLT